MKMKLLVLVTLTASLAGRPLATFADDWDHWTGYSPTGTAVPVPYPSANCQLNSILPENDGGYVALWDDFTNRVVVLERQSPTRTQIWTNCYVLETNENSRVILGGATRILYCSAQRWVLLDRDTGTNVATAEWDQPKLDPNKLIIRDDATYGKDILHVVNGGIASLFDTNMTFITNRTAEPPQGFWASHAGTWLIDLSNRTNHSIRVALITDLVQREIPLPTTLTGGYSEHRVLSADANRMFVMSSINWPTTMLHYFTLFDRTGVVFQKWMSSMEIFTGVTALSDGWLISARSVGNTGAKHYLFRVDPDGEVHDQLRISPSTPFHYVALNTAPPRILHIKAGGSMEIVEVVAERWSFWDYLFDKRDVISPPVEDLVHLADGDSGAPIGGTNSFWLTPICPNSK